MNHIRTYHLQEKERELEELKRTNPELALEEMEKLEKTRIAERATLKHRNSSKYLQMQSRHVATLDVILTYFQPKIIIAFTALPNFVPLLPWLYASWSAQG